MKYKTIPLLIIGIVAIGSLGAGAGIENNSENIKIERIDFSQPNIIENENFVSIDLFEANSNLLKEGKPFLPSIVKVYTYPLGTIINNVKVEYSDPISIYLPKLIEPSPQVDIISSIKVKNTKPIEDVTYENIDVYPQFRYTFKTSAGIINGERVLITALSLNPIQYKPNENKLLYSTDAKIEIKYTEPTSPISFPDVYDLLIISPKEFESALQRFADHKNGRDIKTLIKTLDEIPSYGGDDDQEDIKLFIKDAIETWGIDYLLLIGAGVEGSELFPVRYAHIKSGGIESKFPSDLYYADIYNSVGDFSDWDVDDDGKYAEYPKDIPEVDAVPDLYLGKIPCNNVNELNAYIDKAIYYDLHNKMTNKIVQIGGDTFPESAQSVNEGEYANTVVLTKLPGYTSTKLWGSIGTLKKTKIAEGYRNWPDFVDFSGHGSPISFATHYPKDEHNWIPEVEGLDQYEGWLNYNFDIFLVKNPKKYPIVFHNACSNNKYSDSKYGSDSLSWKTVRHPNGGGIVAFGASGIGYGAHGTHETERLFGWMEVHTFEEIYQNKIVGMAWSNCLINYFNTFSGDLGDGDYKTLLEYSMFGDPTLIAQNGDDPAQRTYTNDMVNNIERIMSDFPLLRIIFLILGK